MERSRSNINEELNFCLNHFYLRQKYENNFVWLKWGFFTLLLTLIISFGYMVCLYVDNSALQEKYSESIKSLPMNKSIKDREFIDSIVKNKNYDRTHRLLMILASVDSKNIQWERISFNKNEIVIKGKAKKQDDLRTYTNNIQTKLKEVNWRESQRMADDSKEICFSLSGAYKEALSE